MVSHEVIVKLIAATTRTGLRVRSALDTNAYQTKVSVTDADMDAPVPSVIGERPGSHCDEQCLPFGITEVSALPATVHDYEGAILVPLYDPVAIRGALRRAAMFRARRSPDPHAMNRTIASYASLIARIRQASSIHEHE